MLVARFIAVAISSSVDLSKLISLESSVAISSSVDLSKLISLESGTLSIVNPV